MGSSGMGEMGAMEMPMPDNTLPMMTGVGQFRPIEHSAHLRSFSCCVPSRSWHGEFCDSERPSRRDCRPRTQRRGSRPQARRRSFPAIAPFPAPSRRQYTTPRRDDRDKWIGWLVIVRLAMRTRTRSPRRTGSGSMPGKTRLFQVHMLNLYFRTRGREVPGSIA